MVLKPRQLTDDFYDDDDVPDGSYHEVRVPGWARGVGWIMAALLVSLCGVLIALADDPPVSPQTIRGAVADIDDAQVRLLQVALAYEQALAANSSLSADVSALRARVSELQAQVPIPPSPLPLAVRVNLYAAPTWTGIMGRTQLWTDITAFTAAEFNTFIANAPRPPEGIGTYLSSCDVVDATFVNRTPAQCIASDKIPAAWRFPSNFTEPGRWTVDLRNPAAVAKLADELVAAYIARRTAWNAAILYLDNVAHPESGDRRFTWSERCAALEAVRARLPAEAKLYVNVTLPPGLWPNVDLQRLARCVNGITFEVALHPSYRDAPHKVASVIADVRELARRNVAVIFALARNSSWDAAAYAREKQLAAAFALLCRERADRPVYAVPGSQPPENPPWMAWADIAGQPLGPEVESGGTWRREFAGGTVSVDPASGSGSFAAR